jgi:hypothetical protein
MDEQPFDQFMKLIGSPGMQCRQGQNHEIHDLLYGCAIEEAAHQRCSVRKVSLRLAA